MAGLFSPRWFGGRGLAVVALLLSVLSCLPCWSDTAAAGEDAVVQERQDGLVESLNATSAKRAPVIEQILNELRGPHSRQMHQTLLEALSRRNVLILQGVIEALVTFGDTGDVDALEALLDTSSSLEVKSLVIRLLPAYCLAGLERARINYIYYAAGYVRVAGPGVLAPLRKPPLNRRGRLDPAQSRLQTRIARILVGQFDPVGAALRYVDDRLYRQSARAAVTHFVGRALGNDPARWAAVWAAGKAGIEPLVPGEVEEIRLQALQSLSDMGAEGLPEVLAAFGELLSARSGDVLTHAVFDTLTVMCETGFSGGEAVLDMTFGTEGAAEGESWRRRRLASAVATAVFAAEQAAAFLAADAEAGVFSSSAACLGASLAYSENFPDPEGRLAAMRNDGLSVLENLLLTPGLAREKRTAVAAALGVIGRERAVAALVGIIASPYCSPEAGLDGARMAEAVVEALCAAAVGGHSGQDAARAELLRLIGDPRSFPPLRAGSPPVGLAHMVLWRLQRLARSSEISFEAEYWRERLGW